MDNEPVKQIIQWDVRNWSQALHYWEKNIEWNNVKHCLELGGREGGLSLWLALKNKDVVCSDVGDVRETAETLHASYGVLDKVRYETVDATFIPYENHFDLIVFKSILGIIGRNNNPSLQQQAINEIYKALKPGGKLIFAENLAGSPLHRLLRKRFVKWGGIWRYVSINDVKSFLEPFSNYSLKSTGFSGLLGQNEFQRNVLAKIDQRVINYCVPDNWKYIIYGIAEK